MSAYRTEETFWFFLIDGRAVVRHIDYLRCNKDIFSSLIWSCIDSSVQLYCIMVATAEMLKLATSHTSSGVMGCNVQLSNLKAMQLNLYDAIFKLFSCWEMFYLRCNVTFLLEHVHHAELPRADAGAWSALASGPQWFAAWWKDALWCPLVIH